MSDNQKQNRADNGVGSMSGSASDATYPLGFSGEGLAMRLRMCAADECHDDEWLSAVMRQAADEIERTSSNQFREMADDALNSFRIQGKPVPEEVRKLLATLSPNKVHEPRG